jgi:uncharacterized membrane protein
MEVYKKMLGNNNNIRMWTLVGMSVATFVLAVVSLALVYNLNIVDSITLTFGEITVNTGSATLGDAASNNSVIASAVNGIIVIMVGAIVMLLGKIMWKAGLTMPAHLVKLVGAVLLLAGSITTLATLPQKMSDITVLGTNGTAVSAVMITTGALGLLTTLMYAYHMLSKLNK